MEGKKLSWDADEFQRTMAAHHTEFDEMYKRLMEKLERPVPRLDLFKTRSSIQELSARGKQIDANLKALQERIRSLPPRNSIPN